MCSYVQADFAYLLYGYMLRGTQHRSPPAMSGAFFFLRNRSLVDFCSSIFSAAENSRGNAENGGVQIVLPKAAARNVATIKC